MDGKERSYVKNPYLKANVFSKLFLYWISPLLSLGNKKILEEEDLYETVPCEKTQVLTDELEKAWEKEKLKKKPSLMRACANLYMARILLITLVPLIQETIRMASPLLVAHLVKYFNDQIDLKEALIYGSIVSFLSIIVNIIHHPYFFYAQRYGMRLRIACGGLIYKKMLKLRSTNETATSSGKILNLLSNDATRIENALLFIGYTLIGPFQGVALIVLMVYTVDFSVLAGLPVLILMIPIQICLGHIMTHYKMKTAKISDERINMTNEVLNGIKIIKMYCWEKPFKKIIEQIRIRELNSQCLVFVFSALNYLSGVDLIPIYSFISIEVFIRVTNMPLLPSHIIFVISYYIRFSLSIGMFLVRGITNLMGASVSFSRIQNFLSQPEVDERDDRLCGYLDTEINVSQMYADWYLNKDEYLIKNVSFTVKPNELLAVVGPVGSGKSSLLMALLGEMPNIKGNVKMNGSVFYVSQEPWIFSSTIKQNILFGKEYNKERFNEVVKICALKTDFKLFPNGEDTLIGDKGVNLSGGQRARVSLARALYNDPDIYLFDDPLSAVDANVAKYLFDKCINGYLKKKIRILVTHQVHHLTNADQIIILDHGSVTAKATYHELIQNPSLNLVSLLSTIKQKEIEEMEVNSPKKEAEKLEKYIRQMSIKNESENLYESMKDISSSRISLNDIDLLNNNEMYEEKHLKGAIDSNVFKYSINKCFGISGLLFVTFIFVLSQVVRNATDFWISNWSNIEEKEFIKFEKYKDIRESCLSYTILNTNLTDLCLNFTLNDSPMSFEHRPLYSFTFSMLTLAYLLLILIRSVAFFVFFYFLIKSLHIKMLTSIMQAKIRFFDLNPLGRIMNRFSKDIGNLDDLLPMTLFDFLVCLMATLGVLIVPVIINAWILIPLVPLFIGFCYLRMYFMKVSRELKRIEGLCRSPIYTHTTNTIYGTPIIRACNNQQILFNDFVNHCDHHTQAFFTFVSVNRWFAIRLDLIVTVYTFVIVYGCILLKGYIPLTPGIVGISLVYVFNVMGVFQWCVRQSAEVENMLTSVERVVEYSMVKGENLEDSILKPPTDWPKNGEILFKNVSFAYDENLPDVLKNISLKINAKEKIGIVGRTGAGKSTIFQTLFRMAEPSGTVLIDDINIKDISLHELRSKIAIIPQEPTLFIGTLRYNLDPFGQYDDNTLWNTLETVQLKEAVKSMKDGLNTEIQKNGANLSVGQKQLICLARAVLKKSKILIIDEATANVDYQTDALIQKAIRECFKDCTVITIAHRLQTIMDSDKILCLSNGNLMNYGHPYDLLQDQTSVLYELVDKLSEQEKRHLNEIAKAKYSKDKESPNQNLTSTFENDTFLTNMSNSFNYEDDEDDIDTKLL